jgi:hypothetical protein
LLPARCRQALAVHACRPGRGGGLAATQPGTCRGTPGQPLTRPSSPPPRGRQVAGWRPTLAAHRAASVWGFVALKMPGATEPIFIREGVAKPHEGFMHFMHFMHFMRFTGGAFVARGVSRAWNETNPALFTAAGPGCRAVLWSRARSPGGPVATTGRPGRARSRPGYDSVPGGRPPLAITSAGAVPRTVGRVDGLGNVDTTTALTAFASPGGPRSAARPTSMKTRSQGPRWALPASRRRGYNALPRSSECAPCRRAACRSDRLP